MIISLGALLPARSCSLPGTRRRRAASRPPGGELCPCLALLQAGVAWPWYYYQRRWSLTPPFHPCRRISPGGMFVWPGPADYSAPGIARRLALWSADFPRPDFRLRPRQLSSVKTSIQLSGEQVYHTLPTLSLNLLRLHIQRFIWIHFDTRTHRRSDSNFTHKISLRTGRTCFADGTHESS